MNKPELVYFKSTNDIIGKGKEMFIRDIYRELNKFTYMYLYNILSAKENDKRVHSSLPSF